MTREILAQALSAEGLESTNQGYAVPESREGTVFVAAPGDILSVDRVLRIDLRDKFVLLENVKHERFYFAYEDVLGLRMHAPATPRDRVAGFGGR
jgi:hypothetical protein